MVCENYFRVPTTAVAIAATLHYCVAISRVHRAIVWLQLFNCLNSLKLTPNWCVL